MDFSEALKAMKAGKTVKRKDQPCSYYFDGSFWLTVKTKDIDRHGDNPIFNDINWQQEITKIKFFDMTIYTEYFCYFDEDDLLAEDWEVVDFCGTIEK